MIGAAEFVLYPSGASAEILILQRTCALLHPWLQSSAPAGGGRAVAQLNHNTQGEIVKRIGLSEAKTNLSKIVETVRHTGRGVTLTKRGQPVVDVVPHRDISTKRLPQAQVLAELAKLRRELTKSSMRQIRSDIDQGRYH
jgi:prevent-host-death family protein